MTDITTLFSAGHSSEEPSKAITPLLNVRPKWNNWQTMLPDPANSGGIDQRIVDYIDSNLNLGNLYSPASYPSFDEKQLKESIFDATAAAKITMSEVAMHVSESFRNRIFSQIDSLHDLDEWDEADKPINKSSFACFIKTILMINPQRQPGLGLSHDGNLMAAWVKDNDRLIAEFLPNDRVEWIVSRYIDEEVDRATGETHVSRLLDQLAPYHPEVWFNK